jgi:protein-tyrosine phosphatase
MASTNIFWIEGEPRFPLAIVLCPRGDNMLYQEIARLKDGGIQTLVSLLEKDEAAWLGLADEGPVAAQLGLNFLSHPIPDVNVPMDTAAFIVFITGLAERLRTGEHVGIHCRGSIGRSTITAACALIHLGWPARQALAVIEAARGCPVPNTLQQESWILQYRALP